MQGSQGDAQTSLSWFLLLATSKTCLSVLVLKECCGNLGRGEREPGLYGGTVDSQAMKSPGEASTSR